MDMYSNLKFGAVYVESERCRSGISRSNLDQRIKITISTAFSRLNSRYPVIFVWPSPSFFYAT
jgi:hypothetical protein